ncbi:MAG: DUF4870 domain-containing protein [Planctomycetota bacterium]|jgi:uncharacterized Tic20 family protein
MDQNMDTPNPADENQPSQTESVAPEVTQQAPEVTALSQDSKNLAMLCHLLGLFTSFIGPLILWLVKKDEDKFVDSQGKEALNFQITIIIAMVASAILTVVVIGVFLWFATVICNLIFCILACVAASKGEDYRYPVSLRLVK